jgi:hypothetical protein
MNVGDYELKAATGASQKLLTRNYKKMSISRGMLSYSHYLEMLNHIYLSAIHFLRRWIA